MMAHSICAEFDTDLKWDLCHREVEFLFFSLPRMCLFLWLWYSFSFSVVHSVPGRDQLQTRVHCLYSFPFYLCSHTFYSKHHFSQWMGQHPVSPLPSVRFCLMFAKVRFICHRPHCILGSPDILADFLKDLHHLKCVPCDVRSCEIWHMHRVTSPPPEYIQSSPIPPEGPHTFRC